MVKLVEDWLALVTRIEQCDIELEEARLPCETVIVNNKELSVRDLFRQMRVKEEQENVRVVPDIHLVF